MALEQCDDLNNQIDGTLDRCLAMTVETQQVGADTAVILSEQKDQIQGIDKKVHEIDEILEDSERSIQTTQSWRKGIIVELSLCFA